MKRLRLAITIVALLYIAWGLLDRSQDAPVADWLKHNDRTFQ